MASEEMLFENVDEDDGDDRQQVPGFYYKLTYEPSTHVS